MKKQKFRPLGKRLLCKVLEEKEESKGGLILPDSSKNAQMKYKVVSEGSSLDDKTIEMGDIVLAKKYSGQEITLDEETFVIFNLEDLIGIIKD
jgi:chaperonin GroES